MLFRTTLMLTTFVAAILFAMGSDAMSKRNEPRKGYDITPTGLTPRDPEGFSCSPLTSLYASWIDVDGSTRDEIHSGVDGGRLNDWVMSPGPGTVRAVWEANWGWGREGALLIVHTRAELGLKSGPPFYYSEFDHLTYAEIKHFQPGQKIARGEPLARVAHPGGKAKYIEEVHWEVWEVNDDSQLEWRVNAKRAKSWTNATARLIDPLYMLALQTPPDENGGVTLTPFEAERDYAGFRGFTYILPCVPTSRTQSQ